MVRHCLLLCTLVFGASFALSTTACAWSNGAVSYQKGTTDYSVFANDMAAAEQQQTSIRYIGDDEQEHAAIAQVTMGKSVRLAYVPLASRYMISVGADTVYHYFTGSYLYIAPTLIAGTNKLTLPLRGVAMDGYNLYISDDITKDVVPIHGVRGQIVRYDVSFDTMQAFLPYQESNGNAAKAYIYDQAFSRNKRYGVFWLGWRDFVRVDFKTGEIRAFLQRSGTWYDGIYANRVSAITNDGRYVFMNNGASVVDVQSACGQVINPDRYNGTIDHSYTQCPERQLDPTAATGYNAWHQSFYLAPNERSASYWLSTYPYTSQQGEPSKVTISVNGQHSGIDYLALGDSYSSGEGDIEKNEQGMNFYLPMTDIANDICHVSSRSYPFLLRDYWGIDEANMKSVACSGAQVVFDYNRPLSGYLGQNNRLSGRQDIPLLQQNAIQQFIPGRAPQLEFVKKYQPSIVTLTGGGNDVGFVNVLVYCAFGAPLSKDATLLQMATEGLYGLATCSFAQNGSAAQKNVNSSIAAQYQYTSKLIESIKQVSPDTQVYVIGYPSFISEGTAVCGNSLELDSDERAAIQYYLHSLNSQLARAANDENVTFIDIEDSLKGGRLCEGSEYVTGATNVLLSGGATQNNMFHPNAKGHEMIAAAIESAIASGGTPDIMIPERPSAVSADTYPGTVINTQLVHGTLPSTGALPLNVQSGQFAPGTNVSAQLHSDIINLGTATTKPDGSIASTLTYSVLPVGFHMLTLEGQGVDGQPLLLYQFVTVDKVAELATTDADGVQQLAANPAAGLASKQSIGQQPLHFATDVAEDALLPQGTAPVVASGITPLAESSQSNDTANKSSQLPVFWFGLCAALFIIAAWLLTRRVCGKAKSKN